MQPFPRVSGFLLLVSLSALAEGGGTAQQGPAQPGVVRGSSFIQVFDDSVFNLEPKNPPPTTRKSASGAERYVGEEADYNSGQRREWLDACEPMKNVDLRAYRECFNNERRRANDRLRQNQAEVENRTSVPLRNVPEPIYDSEAERNPAYDVEVERIEE